MKTVLKNSKVEYTPPFESYEEFLVLFSVDHISRRHHVFEGSLESNKLLEGIVEQSMAEILKQNYNFLKSLHG